MEDEKSGLRFYSIGIVIEDKAVGTDKIKVLPIEHVTRLNGMLKDTKINYESKGEDARGVKQEENASGQAWIPATWRAIGDANRITSPDVYASENVIILTMSNTGDYYWDKLGTEPGIRRQETVQYGFSNLKAPGKAFDNDTSYWMRWDTRNKLVQIHTSNNDGEPFKYDLLVDTASGVFTIARDDVGNIFEMDSANDLFTINSVAGARIVMDKGHIRMHGITVAVTADEKISINAPTIIFNDPTVPNYSPPEGRTKIKMVAADIEHNGLESGHGSSTNKIVVEEDSKETTNSTTTATDIKFNSSNYKITSIVDMIGDVNTSGGNVIMKGGDIIMTGGTITANGEDLTEDRT